MRYLEEKGFLSNKQFGFRARKSTEDAVLQLTSTISTYLDDNEKSIGVFLDLQKAFDTVSIPILLTRLENLGIRGIALKWFQDYLTDRKQCVRVNNCSSDKSTIKYGVPQGSTLGPSLFLSYINELCELKMEGANIQLFADDTVILFHGKTWNYVQELAEKGMRIVSAWLEDSLLTLNVDKTKYLCFHKSTLASPNTLNISIHTYPCNRQIITSNGDCGCSLLQRASEIKYLGIIIDEKLKWKKHISYVATRVRKLIYIFKELRTAANQRLLIQTYKALVECIAAYCICAWGSAAKTYLIELERAQRAVLKVMFYLPFRFPTHNLYEKTSVLTIRKLFIYQIIRRYHKYYVPNITLPNKRRQHYPIPRTKSKVAKQNFNHIAPKLYNKFNRLYKCNNLSNYKIKDKIIEWLNTFNYDKTESLLYDMF